MVLSTTEKNWAEGWTALSEYGYFGELATEASNVIVDASIEAGENLVWIIHKSGF